LIAREDAEIVRRFAEKVITEGLVDSAADFVWEDVVEQVPLPGQGPGLERLKHILRVMRSAFPDLDFFAKQQVAEGDKVASRFEWTGTQKGEFMGIPATGRQVRVWGMVIDAWSRAALKIPASSWTRLD